MGRSSFISGHEFIGTSILFVADASGLAGVYWIDFAKTRPVEEGFQISHDMPWVQGNHEDGVITGLDNMIVTFDKAIAKLQDPAWGPQSMAVESSFWLGPIPSEDENGTASTACCGLRKTKKIKKKAPRDTPSERRRQSDVALLSFLPAFEGTVADKNGTLWKGGCTFALNKATAMGRVMSMKAGYGVHKVGTQIQKKMSGLPETSEEEVGSPPQKKGDGREDALPDEAELTQVMGSTHVTRCSDTTAGRSDAAEEDTDEEGRIRYKSTMSDMPVTLDEALEDMGRGMEKHATTNSIVAI